MKKIKTVIYKCDFCNKIYQKEYFARKHEESCTLNPKNFRPCFSCSYLTKKETKVLDDYENEKILDLLYCKKKNVFLHTPQNELKNNAFTLDENDNIPMPKECLHYSDDYETLF